MSAAPKKEVLICVDNSGSTSMQAPYWKVVGDVVRRYDVGSATFCVWNTTCRTVSYDELLKYIAYMSGDGGTNIDCLVDILSREGRKKYSELVIVTDGQVCMDSVQRATDRVNSPEFRKNWEATTAYILPGYGMVPDTSVVASFIGGTKYKLYGSGSSDTIVELASCDLNMTELLSLLDRLKSDEEMDANYEAIRTAIAGMTVVREAPEAVHDALVRAKSRAMAAALPSGQEEDDEVFTLEKIERCARKHYAGGTEMIASLWDRLIGMCKTPANSFAMDRLRKCRTGREAAAPDAAGVEVATPCETGVGFVCPVSYEDDAAVTLPFGMPEQPLLGYDSEVATQKRLSLTRQPLSALNEAAFMADLGRLVQPPIGKDAFREIKRRNGLNPLTRSPMKCCCMLTNNVDVNDASAKSTLACILFGGDKLHGSFALWMLVLWRALRTSFVSDDEAVRLAIDASMADALRRLRVPMGLSLDGQKPLQKVPLWVALLYAVHSTEMWRDHGARDLMRHLFPAFPAIREALRLVDVDVGGYAPRVEAVAHACALLHEVKHSQAAAVKKRLMAAAVCETDGELLLDAARAEPDATAAYKLSLLLDGVVDQNKSFGDVEVPPSMCVPASMQERIGVGRVYSPHENAASNPGQKVPLCSKTLRPFVHPDPSDPSKTWEHAADARGLKAVSQHACALKLMLKLGRKLVLADTATLVKMLERRSELDGNHGILPVSIVETCADAIADINAAIAERPEAERAFDKLKVDIVMGKTRAVRAAMERE